MTKITNHKQRLVILIRQLAEKNPVTIHTERNPTPYETSHGILHSAIAPFRMTESRHPEATKDPVSYLFLDSDTRKVYTKDTYICNSSKHYLHSKYEKKAHF